MKSIAIIQARIGSTRLPGKVLLPLAGTTVLGCVVQRLSLCVNLDELVVATSTAALDDPVAEEANRLGALVWRGPAEDVLARFCGAAAASSAAVVVRITSDCPLIDGVLVDEMLGEYGDGRDCDYFSNTLVRTYPRGLDAEIFSRSALDLANKDAREPFQREHVTPFLYQHPEVFRLRSYVDSSGADRSHMRWTLDTSEDYAFLQAVYERIPHQNPSDVTTADVISLLSAHPSIARINADVRQKSLGE
jgi:spore coat polysaccharide biosynthesis protein SpsF